jgi:hypothetical protein
MGITAGTDLEATTASGRVVAMRALGEPVRGRDFAVVWVSTHEECERAERDGDEPAAVPWPLDAVRERERV